MNDRHYDKSGRPSPLRKTLVSACFAFAALALISPSRGSAQLSNFNAQLAAQPAGSGYAVSWDAVVDPAIPTGSTQTSITYYVISRFGFTSPGTVPFAAGTNTSSTADKTNLTVFPGPGSRCFVVVASDTWHSGGIFAASADTCHCAVHNKGAGNLCGVTRGDATGQQLGFNLTWSLGYYLDTDSLVTIGIYPPSTPASAFSTDSVTGLSFVAPNTPVTKQVIDHVPRSGEMADASWKNVDTWDSRNSSGATVANGVYIVHMLAFDPLFGGTTRYAGIIATIPVDILRLMNIKTTGITLTSNLATLTYDMTADATVRIVIARPGRKFIIDSNGDVQALDATGTTIDKSTNSVVQVFSFNRKAGLAITETWNGTDTLGVAVSTGVYSVGISASDGYGNHAVDAAGNLNDNGFQTSFPVDRSASQASVGGAPPTINAINVGGTNISLSGGTSVGTFQSITITLSAPSGTGANATIVTLTNPSNGNVAGAAPTISNNLVTFTATSAQSSTGTYTLVITPKDANGNAGAAQSVNFLIPSSGGGGGGATQTQDQFAGSVVPYPNPSRGASANIDFNLTTQSTVNIDIYSLTGNRVFHTSNIYPAGTRTFTWNLVNDAAAGVANGVYLVRVTMGNSLQTLHTTKKIMVLR